MNFNRFGLDDCIEPGEKYLISLRALPIHDDLGSNSLYSKVQVPGKVFYLFARIVCNFGSPEESSSQIFNSSGDPISVYNLLFLFEV